jgi:acetylornithine/N-succinyldiaminopimelate aminotransferase
MEKAFSDEVAGVLVEPIQGEGGIRPATPEYLRTVRQLCDQHGAVMILDEVQSGMGRTGRWYAYQHYDVEPDVITLAKALGGGVAIGAMMARPEIAASLVPGSHASTFGGNPLACAAGIAVIEAIDEENLLTRAEQMGQYLRERLDMLKERHAVIDHVRGIGLMVGVQLTQPGAEIVQRCLDRGLRINCTQGDVLRLMPSMVVTREEIDQAMAILDEVLGEEG